jgi:hypothetical protein
LSLGLPGGLLLAYAIRHVFFGVSPADPLNTVGILLLLALVTMAASVMPALRAATTHLALALRGD